MIKWKKGTGIRRKKNEKATQEKITVQLEGKKQESTGERWKIKEISTKCKTI